MRIRPAATGAGAGAATADAGTVLLPVADAAYRDRGAKWSRCCFEYYHRAVADTVPVAAGVTATAAAVASAADADTSIVLLLTLLMQLGANQPRGTT